MAINLDLYDLENYPGNPKRGTVDIVQMIPTGYGGDEQFVLKFSTTAYSDAVNRTTIDDIYLQETLCGWSKSSGFAGVGGKFTITSSTNALRIKLDGCTGGSYSGYYEIVLDEGVNITGAAIAEDIQAKLRAVTVADADASHSLSYKNAVCVFKNNRFYIHSGSMSNAFSGSNKSSVSVYKASFANSANATLGFDMAIESEELAGYSAKEVITSANYTVGGDTLMVSAGLGVSAGDALYITDGVNTDYFVAVSGTTDTAIKVPNETDHNFNAIANNYTAGAKVQLLVPVDPEFEPNSAVKTVDEVCRWGVMSIINQIDFSG